MSRRTTRNDPLRRVILLRHGVTDWNQEGRWQGRADIPLNPEGLRQAERAAVVLARDADITVVAVSTARRAAQTAAVVKGAFDLAGRPPVMMARDDLVEIDVGAWSGLLQDDVRGRWPEAARIPGDVSLRYGETGETLHEVACRAGAAVRDCLESVADGDALLVVTHGAVIRGVVHDLVGSAATEALPVLGSVGNCQWVELVESAGVWHIERWNAGA